MLRNKIFQLRISEELLNSARAKNPNVSRFIRGLIRYDIRKSSSKTSTSGATPEIRGKTPYTFFATLNRVVDGDTLLLDADLGFYINARVKIRLLGINAPPLDQPDGVKAKRFIEQKLAKSRLVVETRKRGKYGRYLAYIYYHPKFKRFEKILRYGKVINSELVQAGLAEKN